MELQFIFENGEEVKIPSEPKTINLDLEELRILFPQIVDNKHLFDFLELNHG